MSGVNSFRLGRSFQSVHDSLVDQNMWEEAQSLLINPDLSEVVGLDRAKSIVSRAKNKRLNQYVTRRRRTKRETQYQIDRYKRYTFTDTTEAESRDLIDVVSSRYPVFAMRVFLELTWDEVSRRMGLPEHCVRYSYKTEVESIKNTIHTIV